MAKFKYLEEGDCDTSQSARLEGERCYQLKRIADALENIIKKKKVI